MSYKIGQVFIETKVITKKQIEDFAKLSGDFNPIHLDEDYAKNSIFKKNIAHGLLVASYISKILGVDFPGSGSIYISQTLNFLAPVFVDDKIEICIELLDILGSRKNKGKFKTTCRRLVDNSLVLEGEALLLLPQENK